MRIAAGVLAASLVGTLAAGCETTQERSAKIGRRLAGQNADAATTRLTNLSRTVRVTRSAIVTADGQTAVALELSSTDARALEDVPVQIDVRDASGTSIYANNTAGLEPSLTQLALLGARAATWWVDDQVSSTGGAAHSVTARIGTSRELSAAAVPQISAGAVKAGSSFAGAFVSGTLVNHSHTAQHDLAVYAVALRGSRVVAAGHGLVPALGANASSPFELAMVGTVGAATIELTIAPTNLG